MNKEDLAAIPDNATENPFISNAMQSSLEEEESLN